MKSIKDFFGAKKNFQEKSKLNEYIDYQIRSKENEIKRLKLAKDEILNKIETLREDE